jgi:hypothetical protein
MYQMSEVRITYDVNYLIYLIKLFIKNKIWHNALYCFIGVKLIEPDYKDLEKYEKQIFSKFPYSSSNCFNLLFPLLVPILISLE